MKKIQFFSFAALFMLILTNLLSGQYDYISPGDEIEVDCVKYIKGDIPVIITVPYGATSNKDENNVINDAFVETSICDDNDSQTEDDEHSGEHTIDKSTYYLE